MNEESVDRIHSKNIYKYTFTHLFCFREQFKKMNSIIDLYKLNTS